MTHQQSRRLQRLSTHRFDEDRWLLTLGREGKAYGVWGKFLHVAFLLAERYRGPDVAHVDS
jgi:hypothetical protein